MTGLDETDDLIARIAEGSPEALAQLYAARAPGIWRQISGLGAAEAEARLERIFLRIWREAGFYHSTAEASVWIDQIVRAELPEGAPATGSGDSPPPQVLNRIKAQIATRKPPLWRQLVPYVLGAVLAGLLAWGLQQAGVLPVSAQ